MNAISYFRLIDHGWKAEFETAGKVTTDQLSVITPFIKGRVGTTRMADFAYVAVEQAVVNGISHPCYEEREPVQVRISPDGQAMLSFLGADCSTRRAGLQRDKAVSLRYHNRRVGEFLKELDLTKSVATGIPNILRAMQANGSPAPTFKTDNDRTSFLIPLPVNPKSKPAAKNDAQFTEEVGHKCVTRPSSEVLADLLAAGLAKLTISEKPNTRRRMYRITDKKAT